MHLLNWHWVSRFEPSGNLSHNPSRFSCCNRTPLNCTRQGNVCKATFIGFVDHDPILSYNQDHGQRLCQTLVGSPSGYAGGVGVASSATSCTASALIKSSGMPLMACAIASDTALLMSIDIIALGPADASEGCAASSLPAKASA